VALLSLLYVVLILADLPNGIEITGDRFTLGARGVPPAGRLWRRVSGPLEAVRSWDVLTPAQARTLGRQWRARQPTGRQQQQLGDLRMIGRRGVLRVVVDPTAVQVRFPGRVLSGYVFVSSAATGMVWDGVILIGTRKPAALASALDRALPGRRSLTTVP
jgi:hypothetical protein